MARRIVGLTSGRADYSLLVPLFELLQADPDFDLTVIAFGTHVSPYHGRTVRAIHEAGFNVREVETMILGDSEESVARAIGVTISRFSSLWSELAPDSIVALGDRYEMFAAAAASIPFRIPLVHIHGGEETLGAIDNIFRHALTSMATLHCTSHPTHSQRVRQIVGEGAADRVHTVGALGIDSMLLTERLSAGELLERFGVDFSRPTALATFHPETQRGRRAVDDARAFGEALLRLPEQVVLTMPNVDPTGGEIREVLSMAVDQAPHLHAVESMGRVGYYSALNLCSFVLGNSSSGIIEAATFGKWVVDVGERQAGRVRGPNVLYCGRSVPEILEAVAEVRARAPYEGDNVFGNGQAASRILEAIRDFLPMNTRTRSSD